MIREHAPAALEQSDAQALHPVRQSPAVVCLGDEMQVIAQHAEFDLTEPARQGPGSVVHPFS